MVFASLFKSFNTCDLNESSVITSNWFDNFSLHSTHHKKLTDHCLQKKKEVETKVTSLDSDSGAEEGDGQCSQTSVHTLDLNEAPGTILSIFGILLCSNQISFCVMSPLVMSKSSLYS